MQRLGILASILLLTSAIIGPLGISYAVEPTDTQRDSKVKHDDVRSAIDQKRAERHEALKQMASEVKAKLNAKKTAAQKDIDAAISARNEAILARDTPTSTADFIAKLKEQAAEAIAKRKAAGGPSKVQVALEADREAYAKRISEHQSMVPKSPEKDIKYVKETKHDRMKKLKAADAVDQESKESSQIDQQEKATEMRDAAYAAMHHKNRK
jgi:hypothetical protein